MTTPLKSRWREVEATKAPLHCKATFIYAAFFLKHLCITTPIVHGLRVCTGTRPHRQRFVTLLSPCSMGCDLRQSGGRARAKLINTALIWLKPNKNVMTMHKAWESYVSPILIPISLAYGVVEFGLAQYCSYAWVLFLLFFLSGLHCFASVFLGFLPFINAFLMFF